MGLRPHGHHASENEASWGATMKKPGRRLRIIGVLVIVLSLVGGGFLGWWKIMSWIDSRDEGSSAPPSDSAGTSTWLADALSPRSTTRIAIFGDSYSSGEGAGAETYDELTTVSRTNKCHRSENTYLASAGLDVMNVACSGATIADVLLRGQWDEPAQVANPEVASTSDPIEVAFMTIGGNDIGFAPILQSCLLTPDSFIPLIQGCHEKFDFKIAEVTLLKPQLMDVYLGVYSAINTPELIQAREGKVAPLVILPYPNVVPLEKTGNCGMSDNELVFARELLDTLNATMRDSVGELRARGYDGVFFADGVEEALEYHGFCTTYPHVNDPSVTSIAAEKTKQWGAQLLGATRQAWPFITEYVAMRAPYGPLIAIAGTLVLENVDESEVDSRDFVEWGHPSAQGYADTTVAIQAWASGHHIDPATLTPPFEVDARDSEPGAEPPVTISLDTRISAIAEAGQTLRITASGLNSLSPVMASLEYSQSLTLSGGIADEDGNVDLLVAIPSDLPTGEYQLKLQGFDPENQLTALSADLTLTQPPIWWLVPSLITIGALFVIGLLLLAVASIMKSVHNRRMRPART